MSSKTILETDRLRLRQLTAGDAEFIVELLNDPSFVRNIGDRGVRTLGDAMRYIRDGPVENYARLGFGLWRVELKDSNVPVGICGLLKRETLDDVDIGFAFLPRFWFSGYAFESASAVLRHAQDVLELKRIVAVTNPDNIGSIRLLEKLGMSFERLVRLSQDGPELKLFAFHGEVDADLDRNGRVG